MRHLTKFILNTILSVVIKFLYYKIYTGEQTSHGYWLPLGCPAYQHKSLTLTALYSRWTFWSLRTGICTQVLPKGPQYYVLQCPVYLSLFPRQFITHSMFRLYLFTFVLFDWSNSNLRILLKLKVLPLNKSFWLKICQNRLFPFSKSLNLSFWGDPLNQHSQG